MAKRIDTYEIVLAHGGRRDDAVIGTATITSSTEYNALCDRIFETNNAMTAEMRAERAYYAIRRTV